MKSSIPEGTITRIAMLETVLDNVGAYIFTKDLNGCYTYVNNAVLELFDKTLEEVIGFDDSHFFDLKISSEINENDRKVMDLKQVIETEETNYVKSSGELRIYHTVKKPLYDGTGEVIGMCGISTDITEQKKLQQTVHDQKHLLDAVLNNIDAHIYMKSEDRRFLFVNKRVADLFGDSAENIIGKRDVEILPKNVADHFWQSDKKVFETNEKQTIEEVVHNDDGSSLHYISVKIPYTHSGDNEIPALIGFSTDVTELYQLKEQFKQQARTDALTGLYNRRYFIEQAEKEFNRATRHNETISLIIIDVDHFKHINDEFGHLTGDEVLKSLANNLKSMVRVEDTPARIGGEEFAILLPQTSSEHALNMAERIRQYHSDFPCIGIDSATHSITLSIGVSTLLAHDINFDSLFSRADKALYQAKESGRDKVLYST